MGTMKKILFIGDDKAIRLVLSAILKKNNYFPIEVPDGYNTIEIFKTELPCVVLLYIKMPEMNGIQILQEIKKINSDIPVIIVTGYADIPAAVQAIQLDAHDFLQKPPTLKN
jgi:DNA-binding NtrC family response regulator